MWCYVTSRGVTFSDDVYQSSAVDLRFNFLLIDHHLCVYFSWIAGCLFSCMDRWFHCDNGEEFIIRIITRLLAVVFIALKLRLLRKPSNTTRLALFANRSKMISSITLLTSL